MASNADMDLVTEAFSIVDFLIGIVERQGKELRSLRPRQEQPKDYAAECAMKCAEPAFQRYLHEVHDLDHPDQHRAATKVRFLLGIQSRAELNTDEGAKIRWFSLRSDFERWRKS
jgi:hypothetical protein